MRKTKFKRLTLEDYLFDIIRVLFLLLILVTTLYPFLNTLAFSFNEGLDAIKGGIYIYPRKFTLENYKEIFREPILVIASINSVLRTVIGILTQLLCNAMMAFVFSRKKFVFKKLFTALYIIPMYFAGGLIPTYILFRSVGLTNNFAVYWLPGLTGFFTILLMRTYMKGIPDSIVESAYLDGASDFTVFIRIILPLSVPLLATFALFIGVGQWNSWMDTLIYNANNPDLTTLQYELMRKISSVNAQNAATNAFQQSALAKHNMLTNNPKSIKSCYDNGSYNSNNNVISIFAKIFCPWFSSRWIKRIGDKI